MFWITCSNLSTRPGKRHFGKDKNQRHFAGFHQHPNLHSCIFLLLIGLIALAPFPSAARAARPDQNIEKSATPEAKIPFGVFGALEVRTNAKKGLSEWTRYQRQVNSERELYISCDQKDKSCPAHLRAWRHQISAWQGMNETVQLSAVNSWVNANIRYINDRSNFGQADRWATPAQSLKGKGDCEDYALLKYESLKALGLDESRLRIVIVNDTRRGIGHAVLAVRAGLGIYILDNQHSRVLRHESVANYAPVYSINQTGRWINIATRKIKSQYTDALKMGKDPALTPEPDQELTVALSVPSVVDPSPNLAQMLTDPIPTDSFTNLPRVNALLSQGMPIAHTVGQSSVTQQKHFRWRKLYGGKSRDQVERLQELAAETHQFRRAVSGLALEK